MDNLTAHKASEYDQKVRQTIPFYDTIHAEVLRLELFWFSQMQAGFYAIR